MQGSNNPNLEATFIPRNKRKLRTRLDIWLISNPRWATLITAMVLAFIWLSTWMVVLFWITYFTGSPTTALVFIAGLVLSTCAEAVIRVVEMSARGERYSRGVLHEKEAEVSAIWALMIVFGGLFAVAILKDAVTLPNAIEFELKPLMACHEIQREFKMCPKIFGLAKSWVLMFFENKVMMGSLFWCWLLRVVIYRRPWKSRTWKLVSDYMEDYKRYEQSFDV